MAIQDQTETNLVNLRRTIYLTIMSSMDFEEAGHKLMKIELAPGQEMEIVTMLIECCSQEKTYLRWARSVSIIVGQGMISSKGDPALWIQTDHLRQSLAIFQPCRSSVFP